MENKNISELIIFASYQEETFSPYMAVLLNLSALGFMV